MVLTKFTGFTKSICVLGEEREYGANKCDMITEKKIPYKTTKAKSKTQIPFHFPLQAQTMCNTHCVYMHKYENSSFFLFVFTSLFSLKR